MNLDIRAMTEAERKYSYTQSAQLSSQTGCIGYLCGDFGSGEKFSPNWFDQRREYQREAFRAEFNAVIQKLQDKAGCGLLAGWDDMSRFCREHPESAFQGNHSIEYGFQLKTQGYIYMLRCNLSQGEDNLYLFCYQRKLLEQHMDRAKRGIRFIYPDYKERFRLPDGDKIRIITKGGEYRDRTARYIDDTHFELSGEYRESLYHICEFAERFEKTGCRDVIPLRSSLPEKCFSVIVAEGTLIVVTKGERGYRPMGMVMQGKTAREAADLANETMGVTRAQEAAMLAGSMFGWAVPAADPGNYNEAGEPIRPARKDRGEAR